MEKYDYREAVKNDMLEWARENIELAEFASTDDDGVIDIDMDALVEVLSDDCFSSDSVTGNASGSYYCNTWRAEEALCHNWDLLEEALEAFGVMSVCPIEKGAEWCDVTIRCFLTGILSREVAEDLAEEYVKKNTPPSAEG